MTDLIERLRKISDHLSNLDSGSGEAATISEAADTLRALSARVAELEAAQAVRVKPLEWVKSAISGWNDDWHTIPTEYTIRCADENGWRWQRNGVVGYCVTAGGAKAAAQADCERRILSALEPAPITAQQAAEVLLMNRWGGYGNNKAMNAMFNYVHDEHGRHMLPVSHYDGVLKAALTAIATQEEDQ